MMGLLTLGIDVQFCPKTERTSGDVSWDSKQKVRRERLGRFLRLCTEHGGHPRGGGEGEGSELI